jgi:hypothetical protein
VSDCIATTEQLIERWANVLRVLRGLSRHERKKHFNMNWWGDKTACGTVACAAGHCGLDPWFRRRGFKLNFRRDPITRAWLPILSDQEGFDVEGFFGGKGCRNVFHKSDATYKETIANVKTHIKWLRTQPESNGEPHNVP